MDRTIKVSFADNLEVGIDAERSDQCHTNQEGNELMSESTHVSGRPSCSPLGPALAPWHSGLGPTLVLIPDLVLPSWLISSMP